MLAQQFNSHLTGGNIAGLHVEAAAFRCPKCRHKMGRGILTGFETTTSWSAYRKQHREVHIGNCSPPLRCVHGQGFQVHPSLEKKGKNWSFLCYFEGEMVGNDRFKIYLRCLSNVSPSQMSLKCLSSCFHCWISGAGCMDFQLSKPALIPIIKLI